ncbi:YbdD/YjiX family protein [Nocardioides astragali]|uniref:YbdD/YjiX family protein n=1 Tax=Nocardioides astragali TaxID=1776736 RepID=A0ABW2N383_9ACTN|nr:YbdD/YjiX family protein [Nocardioides astragali]
MNGITRIARTLHWYVRQFTGEAKWDEYVAECATTGERPMTRREFEHRRDHQREHSPRAQCC